MVENHAQFQVTREQTQRLEQALEQLGQTASTAEFMARAPAVVEYIRRMRAEIDVYLGLPDIESVHEGRASKDEAGTSRRRLFPLVNRKACQGNCCA